jgi:hypothetical protein
MKLVNESNGSWQYLLAQNEADLLRGLVKKFPFTEDSHVKISRTDMDSKAAEREKLLNESLAAHRKELQMLALNLLDGAKWKKSGRDCRFTLNSEAREILLQILNDIRIGCWHELGEPENLESKPTPISMKDLARRNLMDLAGYFERSLLEPAKSSL